MSPILFAVYITLGCAKSHQPAIEATSPEPPPANPQVVEENDAPETTETTAQVAAENTFEIPESAQSIYHLVNAKHKEDLPDKTTLDAYPNATDGLLWLAENGDKLGIRSRALSLLGFYPSDSSKALVDAQLSAPEAHHLLKSGAYNAIAKWPAEVAVERIEAIRTGLQDDNPLVVIAAAEAGLTDFLKIT